MTEPTSTITASSRFPLAQQEAVASQIALYFTDTGCGTQDYPRVTRFTHTGDNPPSGWTPYATTGLVETVACNDYLGNPGFGAIRTLGSGLATLEHAGSWIGVSAFGDWVSVTMRGHASGGTTTILATYYWEDTVPGWGHAAGGDPYFLVTDVAVEDGDTFDIYVSTSLSGMYYRSVGTPNVIRSKLWGDLRPPGNRVFLRASVSLGTDQ